jgi:DNA (cytosine-5)-methyltransferase 1
VYLVGYSTTPGGDWPGVFPIGEASLNNNESPKKGKTESIVYDNYNYKYRTDGNVGTLTAHSGNLHEGFKIKEIGDYRSDEGWRPRKDNNCPTLAARAREDGSGQPLLKVHRKGDGKEINNKIAPTLTGGGNSGGNHSDMAVLKVKSATSKGYEVATEGDSINLSQPNSETRRGRVGKGKAQTLETSCNQAVVEPMVGAFRGRNPKNPSDRTTGAPTEQRLEINKNGTTNTLTSVQKDNVVVEPIIGAIRGRNPENPNDNSKGIEYKQRFEYNKKGTANALTSDVTMNMVVEPNYSSKALNETIENNELVEGNPKALDLYNRSARDESPTLTEPHHNTLRMFDGYRIRRLTPIECERLQGFPDNHTEYGNYDGEVKKMSNTQRYKQCGNAVTVDIVALVAEAVKPLFK